MDLEELKAVVRGAHKIAWEHGGGSVGGDLSAMIPLLQHALGHPTSDNVQKLLIEAGKQKS